jgi:hypothetical protein
MTTMPRAMMLKLLPYELKAAIQRVGMLEIQPWISIIKVVSKKTW